MPEVPPITPAAATGPSAEVPPPAAVAPIRRRRLPRGAQLVLVIAVVGIAFVAGVAYLTMPKSSVRNPYPAPAGWVSFGTAWGAISPLVQGLPGGFTTVVYVQGIGANAPWSPPLGWYWEDQHAAVKSCDSILTGESVLNFWNRSLYPYSSSATALESGTAPLWTVVFENASADYAVASWLNGSARVNGVVGAGTECARGGAFPGSPVSPVTIPSVDSDAATASLLRYTGTNFTPWKGVGSLTPPWLNRSPQFVAYSLGPILGTTFQTSGGDLAKNWSIGFGGCGLTGSPVRDQEYYFEPSFNSGGYHSQFGTGLGSCYTSAIDFQLENASFWTSPNGTTYFHEFRFANLSLTSSLVPSFASLDQLNVSILSPRVEQVAGYAPMNSTAAMCGRAILSPTDCPAVTTGWYVVLLSSSGAWLDSYPSTAGGQSWTLPGIPVVSGDLLLLVDASPHLGLGTIGLRGGDWLQASGTASVCLGPIPPGCP